MSSENLGSTAEVKYVIFFVGCHSIFVNLYSFTIVFSLLFC